MLCKSEVDRSRLLLALVLGGAAALYLQFFHTLVVPNPDFFGYRGSALSLLHGSLPSDFKRLPLFPLLIGLVSLLIPGAEPDLLAAEALNLLLAPVCLWLIYRIAREFVTPATSLAIVALCAVNRAMVHSVAEAMQDVTILTTMLLTVYLALRSSGWAYVAAFLASVTRQEMVFMIPLVVLQDRLTTTGSRRARSLLWGFLASLGVVWWAVLSFRPSAKVPYLEEMLTRQGQVMAFVKGALRVAVDFIPRQAPASVKQVAFLLELALLAGGAAALIRQHRFRMVVLLGGLGTYTAVHTLFPAHVNRYVVPILWLLYVLMAVAVERGIKRLGWSPRAPLRWLAALALLVAIGSGLSSACRYMTRDGVRLQRVQFRRVGEWYRSVARPGDKMVVQFKTTVQYYSGLPEKAFLSSKALESTSPEGLLDELRAKGITYIVWDNKPDPTGYYTIAHKMWLLNWMKARPAAGLEPVLHVHEGPHEAIVYRVHPDAAKGGP